jgi:hypothetical protein
MTEADRTAALDGCQIEWKTLRDEKREIERKMDAVHVKIMQLYALAREIDATKEAQG